MSTAVLYNHCMRLLFDAYFKLWLPVLVLLCLTNFPYGILWGLSMFVVLFLWGLYLLLS